MIEPLQRPVAQSAEDAKSETLITAHRGDKLLASRESLPGALEIHDVLMPSAARPFHLVATAKLHARPLDAIFADNRMQDLTILSQNLRQRHRLLDPPPSADCPHPPIDAQMS